MNIRLKEKFAYLLSLKNIGIIKAIQILSIPSSERITIPIAFLDNLYRNPYLSKLIGKYELKIISKDEPEYPEILRQIPYAPELLFCLGDVKLLHKNLVTIVGTRNYTGYGKRIVNEIISISNIPNLVYVSGLAKGIDAEVHKLSLCNRINTISVVAGGLDKGFPRENERVFYDMVKSGKGLIISEFPPGRIPIKGMFPMRNRILAGLSKLTVVVEAGEKSGAMITAQDALDFGREVATFPHNIFQTEFGGNNKLFAQGALPLVCKEDFIVKLETLFSIVIPRESNEINRSKLLGEFPTYIYEYLVKRNVRDFTFEEIAKYAYDTSEIDVSKVAADLTKAEMQGILSLNNLGTYRT
jgi:DNA processing protein